MATNPLRAPSYHTVDVSVPLIPHTDMLDLDAITQAVDQLTRDGRKRVVSIFPATFFNLPQQTKIRYGILLEDVQ